jgi:hypothetical protein
VGAWTGFAMLRKNRWTRSNLVLSISLSTEEAKILRRRAKRIYDGNVSRVVSDAIRYIAYEERRDALIASFRGKGTPRSAEAAELDHAWGLVAKKSA